MLKVSIIPSHPLPFQSLRLRSFPPPHLFLLSLWLVSLISLIINAAQIKHAYEYCTSYISVPNDRQTHTQTNSMTEGQTDRQTESSK
jgi:hypothetical protein